MSETYDLAKAGFDAALAPFADMIRRIAGPGADEVGLIIQDRVKVFRLKRQIRLYQKTKEILEQAGLEPRRVPLKLLVPIIDNATLEEDDSLQDMWAALLANNAMGNGLEAAFADILRQLSPADAYLLRNCFREVMTSDVARSGGFMSIQRSIKEWTDTINRLDRVSDLPMNPLSLENLNRLGLIIHPGVVQGIGDVRLTNNRICVHAGMRRSCMA